MTLAYLHKIILLYFYLKGVCEWCYILLIPVAVWLAGLILKETSQRITWKLLRSMYEMIMEICMKFIYNSYPGV